MIFVNKKIKEFGNGKIDRYPLKEELKIRKILIIRDEIFKELKREFKNFKEWLPKLQEKKERKNETRMSKSNLSGQSQKQNKPRNDNYPKHQSIYVPTDMWNTANSKLWRWRQVKNWAKEITQENENREEKVIKEKIQTYRSRTNKSFGTD